jgi:hypothetical protein
MFRGTTPDLVINVGDIDMSHVTELWLTLSQHGTEKINKTLDDVTVDGSTISCTLTQEETLSLKASPSTVMQMRFLMDDGQAMATPIVKVPVEAILKDGVIGETEEP